MMVGVAESKNFAEVLIFLMGVVEDFGVIVFILGLGLPPPKWRGVICTESLDDFERSFLTIFAFT